MLKKSLQADLQSVELPIVDNRQSERIRGRFWNGWPGSIPIALLTLTIAAWLGSIARAAPGESPATNQLTGSSPSTNALVPAAAATNAVPAAAQRQSYFQLPFATVAGWVVAGIAGIFLFFREVRIMQLKGRLEIQQKTFDLLIAYDKELRAERLHAYKRILMLMVNLPKYPGPVLFDAEGLLTLSLAFRDWYFEGGGLVMTEHARDAYFDLQDGCKIVLLRCQGKCLPTDRAGLATFLDRKNWNIPEEILFLVDPGREIASLLA